MTDLRLDKLWFDVLSKRQVRKKEEQGLSSAQVLTKEQRAVLNAMKKMLPELFEGKNISLSRKDVEKFMSRNLLMIRDNLARAKRYEYFRSGLKRGNELGRWDIEVPPKTSIILKEKNRIRPTRTKKIGLYRTMEEAFQKSLKDPIPGTREERFGQILCSAILFGGLHHNSWIDPFVNALENRHIYIHQDWLWLDLWNTDLQNYDTFDKRFSIQTDAKVYRRWFADRLTHILICRWRKNADALFYESQNESSAEICLQSFLDTLDLPKKPSLNQLIKIAVAGFTLKVPPFLAAYADNSLTSSSLPDEIWIRLLTGKNVPIRKRQRTKRFPPAKHSFRIQEQKEFLRTLRKHLTSAETESERIENLKGFLNSHRGEICPILQAITLWVIQLLSDPVDLRENRKNNKPLALLTIKNYLKIAEPLLVVFRARNPDEMGLGEFHERYIAYVQQRQEYAERIHTNEDLVSSHIDILDAFHGYLVVFRNAPDINLKRFKTTLTNIRGARVHANLITVQQYKKILEHLCWRRENISRRTEIAIVAIILAFRAGLRKSEILGLQIRDIQGSSRIEVLVRRNDFRRVKSFSGRRRIPLYLLVPSEELAFIRRWYQFRVNQPDVTPMSILFTTHYSKNEMLPDKDIIAPVRTFLKRSTVDETFVFHDLRHCFITWFLLKMLMRDDIPEKKKLEFLKDGDFDEKARRDLKKAIFHNEPTGKKALYACSILAGHESVAEDFHSYMHLTDWLLGYYLRHECNDIELGIKEIKSLTDCHETRAFQFAKDSRSNLQCCHEYNFGIANDYQHPLLTETVNAPKPPKPRKSKNLFPPLEVALSLMKQEAKEGGGRWKFPKNRKERKAITRSYLNLLGKNNQPSYAQTAKRIFKNYNPENGSVFLEDHIEARVFIDFVKNLCDVEIERTMVKYLPLSEARKPDISKGKKCWEDVFGFPLESGPPSTRGNSRGSVKVIITSDWRRESGGEISQKKSYSFAYFLNMIVLICKKLQI